MPNLADPTREPTDEDLRELAREAFADVTTRHAAALSRLRDEIAVMRNRVLTDLDRRRAEGR